MTHSDRLLDIARRAYAIDVRAQNKRRHDASYEDLCVSVARLAWKEAIQVERNRCLDICDSVNRLSGRMSREISPDDETEGAWYGGEARGARKISRRIASANRSLPRTDRLPRKSTRREEP
jgi:hypothetical protein